MARPNSTFRGARRNQARELDMTWPAFQHLFYQHQSKAYKGKEYIKKPDPTPKFQVAPEHEREKNVRLVRSRKHKKG